MFVGFKTTWREFGTCSNRHQTREALFNMALLQKTNWGSELGETDQWPHIPGERERKRERQQFSSFLKHTAALTHANTCRRTVITQNTREHLWTFYSWRTQHNKQTHTHLLLNGHILQGWTFPWASNPAEDLAHVDLKVSVRVCLSLPVCLSVDQPLPRQWASSMFLTPREWTGAGRKGAGLKVKWAWPESKREEGEGSEGKASRGRSVTPIIPWAIKGSKLTVEDKHLTTPHTHRS